MYGRRLKVNDDARSDTVVAGVRKRFLTIIEAPKKPVADRWRFGGFPDRASLAENGEP